jgi:glycosyltransferase involved in cell wall biosynthesis
MIYFPDVSVIVPVYNAEATLQECVDSILNIDYPKGKLELIFVNNNSTDNTEKILKKYGSEIKVLYENKKGPAAARNKGLLNASGEVVAFTDSDCVVDRNWLKHFIIPLKDKQVGITGGKILAKRPCNKIESFGESIHDHHSAINVFKPPYVITMNWASRLDVLKELNFFNEDFIRCEDVELSHRIFVSGYKIIYTPEAIVYHRNEKTLIGLFREGYLHGLYSVQFIKQYRDFILKSGHRRINLKSYKQIITDFKDFLTNGKGIDSLCSATFNSGKKAGKILGSFKYSYLDI